MKYQRQAEILRYVNEVGSVSISELIERFQVSKATLNRDLTALEKNNDIKKVHGGVVSTTVFQIYEPPIRDKEAEHQSAKIKIAKQAVQMIKNNQTIILDTGSTIFWLAKELLLRKDIKELTVITADIQTAYILSTNDNISLYVLGGTRIKESYDLYDQTMFDTLSSLIADTFFMAGSAFDIKTGVTHSNQQDIIVKEAMMKCARHTVFCTDSYKYGVIKRWKLCSMEDLDTIITDTEQMDEEKIAEITSMSKDLVLAE